MGSRATWGDGSFIGKCGDFEGFYLMAAFRDVGGAGAAIEDTSKMGV
jgi:hypothetical protein